MGRRKILNCMVAGIPRIQSALNFSLWMLFWIVAVVRKYLNSATVSMDIWTDFISRFSWILNTNWIANINGIRKPYRINKFADESEGGMIMISGSLRALWKDNSGQPRGKRPHLNKSTCLGCILRSVPLYPFDRMSSRWQDHAMLIRAALSSRKLRAITFVLHHHQLCSWPLPLGSFCRHVPRIVLSWFVNFSVSYWTRGITAIIGFVTRISR
jgi:hypothetical protein